MDWHDDVRTKLRAALVTLMAFLAPLGPASDACANAQGAEQVTTLLVPPGPASDAYPGGIEDARAPATNQSTVESKRIIQDAVREVHITIRLIEAFESSEKIEFRRYVETLGEIVERAPQPVDLAFALRLSSELRIARGRLEREITAFPDWRRLMLAVQPNVTVTKVPARFIRRADREPESLAPWTESERRAWTNRLDD